MNATDRYLLTFCVSPEMKGDIEAGYEQYVLEQIEQTGNAYVTKREFYIRLIEEFLEHGSPTQLVPSWVGPDKQRIRLWIDRPLENQIDAYAKAHHVKIATVGYSAVYHRFKKD